VYFDGSSSSSLVAATFFSFVGSADFLAAFSAAAAAF
jgi:hypothetical protein